MEATTLMTKPRDANIVADDLEEYRAVKEIVDRTNKENPDPADVAKLKEMLAASPRLWRVAGDYSEHAIYQITSDIEGTVFVVESVRAGVDKLKEDLGYKSAPPLEKLLINQISLCWLRLNMLERTHWIKTYESHISEDGLYWDRRLNNAQRRFTRACDSLARVRKLILAAELHKAQLEAIKATTGGRNAKPLRVVKSA
jgi:hypothetical protein